MSMHLSVLRTGLWTALVPAVFLAGETCASAQKLRGPTPMPAPGQMSPQALLLPRFSPGLMNNGSLQTTQNPNANLPNQAKFIYIAAMPLGDRLGNNGVYYDTDLLPNIGLFQGGQNLFGQVNQQNNNINNPIQPPQQPLPPVQAAFMARQRMMRAMYANYYQQAMMQAYFSSMSDPTTADSTAFPSVMGSGSSLGSASTSSPRTIGGFTSYAPQMNNVGFGAGFQRSGN